MLEVAVGADDCLGIGLRRTALLPSLDDFSGRGLVVHVTLAAHGVDVVGGVHFLGWGTVEFVHLVWD
jgi:hypothetical protein